MCECDLRFGRLRLVFDTMMHRDDNNIRSLSEALHIAGHCGDVSERNARIHVGPVSVLLVECIAKKSEAHAVAFQNYAPVCGCFRFATSKWSDVMRAEPVYRELDAMRGTVTSMVVGGRTEIDNGKFQTGDRFRRCVEDQAV